MKYISLIVAVLIWLGFIYTAFVAITVHLIPHVLASKLDHTMVLFLLMDAIILQFLSWIYKKLPEKPRNRAFTWMEKVSII